MGSSVQGDSSSFCCRSAWNLVFTSFWHRLPTLSFFLGLPFFLSLGLNCSLRRDDGQCGTLYWASLLCEERLSDPVGAPAHSQVGANFLTEGAFRIVLIMASSCFAQNASRKRLLS